MWETLDFRDAALVRGTQRELLREARMRKLARDARTPRRGIKTVVVDSLAAARDAMRKRAA